MGTFASGELKTIERLYCYIKDDSMIATYVGVPKSEVVRIRAKARRAPSERIGPSLDGPPKASERPGNCSVIKTTNADQGHDDDQKSGCQGKRGSVTVDHGRARRRKKKIN